MSRLCVRGSTPTVVFGLGLQVAVATPGDKNHMGHGDLSSSGDRDHFKFVSMSGLLRYEIKVTGTADVFVNGTAVSLDLAGVGTFQAREGENLIGITGSAPGAYSFTMKGILPTP